MLNDKHGPTEHEFVDFAYYGKVVHVGLERPPDDDEEPRLMTLTHDTRCEREESTIGLRRVPPLPTPDSKGRGGAEII
jgi:hypothetical protein